MTPQELQNVQESAKDLDCDYEDYSYALTMHDLEKEYKSQSKLCGTVPQILKFRRYCELSLSRIGRIIASLDANSRINLVYMAKYRGITDVFDVLEPPAEAVTIHIPQERLAKLQKISEHT